MKLSRWFASWLAWRVVPIVLAGLLGGCGGGGGGSSSVVSPTSTPQPTPIPTAGGTPIALVQRVACVGDSITFGAGVSNIKTEAYPSILAKILGPNYVVDNWGLSGTTMIDVAGDPYEKREIYMRALQSKPDIVVIMLGTNDSVFPFDTATETNFKQNYRIMIAAFRSANPSVKLYLCLPIPSLPFAGPRNTTLRSHAIPAIKEIAAETNLPIIDLYAALIGHPKGLADGLHPNARGTKIMASQVYTALTGKEAPK